MIYIHNIYIYIYIYKFTNLQVNAKVRLPHVGAEIVRTRKRFWHPLLTSKPATMTQSPQPTISPSLFLYIFI